MKKTSKFIGLVGLLLAVGTMVGCGEQKSSSHTHKYVQDKTQSVEATCQADGKKVSKCSVCGDVKEETLKKVDHKYVEKTEERVASTCKDKGHKVSYCKWCQDKKQEELPLADHTYVEDTEQSVAPTCKLEGKKVSICSVCGDKQEEVLATVAHSWAEAEDQTGAEAPTCSKNGTVIYECSECHDKETRDVAATGHVFENVGDPIENAGYATLQKQECSSKCGETVYAWNPGDVTDDCKAGSGYQDEPNIVEANDGWQFFGRPIGDAVTLDASGNATEEGAATEENYDENIVGSYFEYKIKLPVAIKGARLVSDLKPGNYTSEIFKVDPSAADWTPGLVKEEGTVKKIEDFRYIVYVDGVKVELDATISNQATGSQQSRDRVFTEFPFTKDFAAGDHTIRIVMAGGYKHTFFSFGLATTAEAGPLKTWAFNELTAIGSPSKKSGKMTAEDTENTDLYKLGENQGFSVTYNSPKAQKVMFKVYTTTKYSNISKADIYFQTEGETTPRIKYQVSVNDVDVTMPTTGGLAENFLTTQGTFSDSGNLCVPVWFDYVEIDLVAGENVIKLVKPNNAGYSFYFGGAAIA